MAHLGAKSTCHLFLSKPLQLKSGSFIFKGCKKKNQRIENATEMVCDPAKPKIFPIWLFTEKAAVGR